MGSCSQGTPGWSSLGLASRAGLPGRALDGADGGSSHAKRPVWSRPAASGPRPTLDPRVLVALQGSWGERHRCCAPFLGFPTAQRN